MTIARIVRAKDWWNYKLPPLLAVAYAIVFVGEVPFRIGAGALAPFLVFLAATASFGYFVNDLCDIQVDRTVAKRNAAGELSVPGRVAVVMGLAGLVFAPWLSLPRTVPILVLIIAELALFVAYSAPPIRLKARGAPALVADALYAHTVPMLIVVLTFAELGGGLVRGWAWALVLVAAWSFLAGFRGILLHQVDDLQADLQASVKTAVSPASRARAVSIVALVLLPAEVVLFAALGVLMSAALPYFVVYAGVVLAILVARVRREARREAAEVGAETGHLHRRRRFADFLGSWVLNDFYEKWMPIYPLLLLSLTDPMYCIVAVGHLLLFRSVLPRG